MSPIEQAYQQPSIYALPEDPAKLSHRRLTVSSLTVDGVRLPDNTAFGKMATALFAEANASLAGGVLTLSQPRRKPLSVNPTKLAVFIQQYNHKDRHIGVGSHPGMTYLTVIHVVSPGLDCCLQVYGASVGQYLVTQPLGVPVLDLMGIAAIDAADDGAFNDRVNALGYPHLTAGTGLAFLDKIS